MYLIILLQDRKKKINYIFYSFFLLQRHVPADQHRNQDLLDWLHPDRTLHSTHTVVQHSTTNITV